MLLFHVCRQFIEIPNAQSFIVGVAIAPVDQSFQSPVRLRFSQDVLGRSPGQMQEYWLRETYSGREVPPPVRDSDAAVLEFVRANEVAELFFERGRPVFARTSGQSDWHLGSGFAHGPGWPPDWCT